LAKRPSFCSFEVLSKPPSWLPFMNTLGTVVWFVSLII